MFTDCPSCFRDAPAYGWPFYMARKVMRGVGRSLLRRADALSLREKYTFASNFRPLLPDNESLRNRHHGQQCFILGTGPSLAKQDIAPLAGELTLAMNGFLRHPLMAQVAPTYYLFADNCYFDGSEPSGQFLAEAREKIVTSRIIAPYSAAHFIAANRLLDVSRMNFVAYAGILRSANVCTLDFTRPVPQVMNCAQLAIMLAMYMGCSKIHLVGLDHDWLAHRQHEGHFYQGKTIEGHAVAHGDKWKYSYLDQMQQSVEVWNGYYTLYDYAQRNSIEIINCTAGGFLDVFPRANYEEVVGLAKAGNAPTAMAA